VLRRRIIPCLLLRGSGLVKTRRFKDPRYIGDAINAVRIFNDKEADELIVVDIEATPEDRPPNFELVRDLASECFMPLAYGGGVRSVDHMDRLFSSGVEKVAVNTACLEDLSLISAGARKFGGQSVVGCIDVRRRAFGGQRVVGRSGGRKTGLAPVEHARRLEGAGAGELILQSVDLDGTKAGYDVPLVREVVDAVRVPVIALGGAGSLDHLAEVIVNGGAAAASAGSLFVFHGRHDGVLINMPSEQALDAAWDRVSGT
jgi:cyclase